MFFTQDDYKKIQQWIIKNSVRDTEFNEANIPFNGEETITIVQGNQNKKVFLKDLIAQVFNLGISDFVNITDKYDAPNISLEEAIRYIPSRARKEGQVITFLDMENHWHIYQFKGVLNQWNVLDQWEGLFNWENLIIDSILPDEEDLTKSLADKNGNSYLSLKDRRYEPENYSGLGRIILRKNIVNIENPIYGEIEKNILNQDMFKQSNTIYEIRYDYDLNGASISLPSNCTMYFQGGSISNGTIVLNNTLIQPLGCNIKNYIKASIEGTYRKGQILYSEESNQIIVWTGSEWGQHSSSTIFRNYNNKLQSSNDGGKTWEDCSDAIAHYFRVKGNKLQISDDKSTWNDVSDYIASWFRWSMSEDGNKGKIQISRDNGISWQDLSKEFSNNLFISKYIGADEDLPIEGISEGTIYAKGPYYSDDDVSQSNPKYRLWVYSWSKNVLGWIDNGEYQSFSAGVSQETGDNESIVMSQKATTNALLNLDTKITDVASVANLNLTLKNNATGKPAIECTLKKGEEYIVDIEWKFVTGFLAYVGTNVTGEGNEIDNLTGSVYSDIGHKVINYIPSVDVKYWVISPASNYVYNEASYIKITVIKKNTIKNINEELVLLNEKIENINTTARSKKKIATLGDSITYRGDYQKIISKYTGWEFVNYGISGARIESFPYHLNRDEWPYFVDRILEASDFEGVDAIVICGYANTIWDKIGSMQDSYVTIDAAAANASNPLSNYRDTIIANGFVPALRSVIEYLLKICPSIPIMLTSNLPMSRPKEHGQGATTFVDFKRVYNGSNATLREFTDAMKEVAEYYSIPFVDMDRNGQINIFNYQTYYDGDDTTHPNIFNYDEEAGDYPISGMKMMATLMLDGLNKIL